MKKIMENLHGPMDLQRKNSHDSVTRKIRDCLDPETPFRIQSKDLFKDEAYITSGGETGEPNGL